MNIELIKKYKTEFDHFLNEGKLLTRTKSNFIWNDKINEDLMWDFEIQDIDIIIDDEYSELRKALCDGKTIQAYYKFNDTWNDIIKPEFKDNVSNYRIKPEEPKFKIGNFVRNIHLNTIHIVDRVIPMDDIRSNIHVTPGVAYFDNELTKWEPQVGELCVYPNGYNSFSCSRFVSSEKQPVDSKIITLALFENDDSYDIFGIEPFINSKPSWFK